MRRTGQLYLRPATGLAAAYGVAVAGKAAAGLLRWVLGYVVGQIPPFITFYPVVLASAAPGGTKPGLLATLLTALAAPFFFSEPGPPPALPHLTDLVALAIFIAINVAISLFGGRFRRARQAIQSASARLDRANAELEQKVRDRTAQLQETVAELEHFSYTITHDMRAPLRAMRGFGGILLEQCADCLHPERREDLRRITDSADRMDRLITDALQYSGAVRQRFDLEPVDTDALLRGMPRVLPPVPTAPRANPP